MSQSSQTSRSEPDWLRFQTWQGADDDHPAGSGKPAYRIVFKTLRMVVQTTQIIFSPNLSVRFGDGSVQRGGVNMPGALHARQSEHWVLPEFGKLSPSDAGLFRYKPTGVADFVFKPWQDEVHDVFFVEFIVLTDATNPVDQLTEGRQRLAALKTMLDLRFGPRLLGVVLTEEPGETFNDWHFNRNVSSQLIGHEFQLDVAAVTQTELREWNDTDLARYMARPLGEKRRLGLASQWYWTAIHEEDPVTQYLGFWFVIEVLLLPAGETNIRPVREFLAKHVGGDQAAWSEFVGRHFGRRSAIVHGDMERNVDATDVASLRRLVETILSVELDKLGKTRADELCKAAGVSLS